MKTPIKSRRLRLGIIGAGAIGSYLAKGLDRFPQVEHISIWDKRSEASEVLVRSIRKGSVCRFPLLVKRSDMVVEAASQEAVREYSDKVLKAGRDLMILSVGALSDDSLLSRLLGTATAHGCKIYVPSGAIGGIDALKASAQGEIRSVTLETRKPPEALGVKTRGSRRLFQGSARRAVRDLPVNVNVAATMSLAGFGFDKTAVKVYADPRIRRNTHRLTCISSSGRLEVTVVNVPSPSNPKTSLLAAQSALTMLQRILSPIEIGT